MIRWMVDGFQFASRPSANVRLPADGGGTPSELRMFEIPISALTGNHHVEDPSHLTRFVFDNLAAIDHVVANVAVQF